ncbi:Indole-3-glycerol phosphate synthase [Candidatus Johnevansia muelleri]|uniref:indole-3-glycerol-phosphate synthase n=1 Tax=Candidatus Johnevansia muelleri TaxID=1495769 RepID=A0A078KEE7_9GAMM|nr:Indole-3-glycerol phosphate synthase [Candidatus Evansia muelleri]
MNLNYSVLKKIINFKYQEYFIEKKIYLKYIEINNIISNQFIYKFNIKINNYYIALIAEIKKTSPSLGLICNSFNPINIAKNYEKVGMTCLSIITDNYFFHGNKESLFYARIICKIPILRKDFIINEYQIYESKALSADCILLIVAALSDKKLYKLYKIAISLGLDVIIEIHNLHEFERIIKLNLKFLGINNRDLHTFETFLEITNFIYENMYKNIILITESGIINKYYLLSMLLNKINIFLIGEYFINYNEIIKNFKNFIN